MVDDRTPLVGVHRCPVCNGTGRAVHWDLKISDTGRTRNVERCKPCGGTGIVVSVDPVR